MIYSEPMIYESAPSGPVVPGAVAPQPQMRSLAPAPADQPPAIQPEAGAATRRDGYLNVRVPEEAKVYVNGHLTRATGTNREYVSRKLETGQSYTYEVRAEVERDGRKVEQLKTVNIRGGDNLSIAFDFKDTEKALTKLTVHVPEDAKVSLAGSATSGRGSIREFTTDTLEKGREWSNYKVVVSVERNGRTVSKTDTLTIKGGEAQSLSFDFDAPEVASR